MGYRIKKFTVTILFVFLGSIAGVECSSAGEPSLDFPVKGMVTMVDFGANTCVPCRMMEPVLKKLKKEYEGRAAVVFVNVLTHKQVALDLGVRAIPVQFFYNKEGEMVYRHDGFMSEEKIRAKMKELGVQ
ncbi:MAG: thioredoxin family protein [Desulfatiglandaceae bacterium]